MFTNCRSYELISEGSLHHVMHVSGVILSLLLHVKCISIDYCIQSTQHDIQQKYTLHVSTKIIVSHSGLITRIKMGDTYIRTVKQATELNLYQLKHSYSVAIIHCSMMADRSNRNM